MAGSDRFEDFVPGALAALGIEADDTDLAVMSTAHGLYWPAIRELISADLGGVEPEQEQDLSRAPGSAPANTSRDSNDPSGGGVDAVDGGSAPAVDGTGPAGRSRLPTDRAGSPLDLLDRPIREQAAAIGAGEADPTELLDAALERIGARNPAINAVVETFPERSREMLAAAPRGPLHGVPVVIKDEWPLPWRAQRFGASRLFAEVSPGESGPYRALRDAGAVIVGVANMHELGSSSTGNASVYGPARNPWDTERCPGGSSSGPAAAVSARLVGGAVGADGIGSIRYPAAYCGLTGLKPTFGRSAMGGHHLASSTTTLVSGPICTDAADCRLLGSALFGEGLGTGEASGLRIGLIRGTLAEDCAPAVVEACDAAVEDLRAETGGEVSEVSLEGIEAAVLATVLIGTGEGNAAVTPAQLNSIGDEIGPVNRAMMKYRLLIPSAASAKASRIRDLMRRVLVGVFAEVDVIACPTVPATAPPLAEPRVELPSGPHTADEVNPRGGALANLTGIPAISVPVGLEAGRMPIALQLQGAWGADALLLDAAEALERANGRRWVEALPPLAMAEPARG